MTTGLDIITKAMQKAGILVKSEAPDADEANDGLSTLNAMLSSWSNDSMLIYARTLESFTLSSLVSDYTIGPGMTLNTARPTFVVSAYVRQATSDYDLTVVPDEVYAGITVKSAPGIPEFLNYTNGFPTGTIKLYPVPSTNYTLFILSEKVLSSLTLAGDISFPPGWEQALIYNLAVLLAPEYGQQLDPLVLKIANDSKGSIQRAILKTRSMDAQASAGTKKQIFNGGFI